MRNGEIDLFMSLDSNEATSGIGQGTLPPTARAYTLHGRNLGRRDFLAIPFDAAHKEAGMLLANVLISPEAQAIAIGRDMLAGQTVLALDRLAPGDRQAFSDPPRSVLQGRPSPLSPEPDPSWMARVVANWHRLIDD